MLGALQLLLFGGAWVLGSAAAAPADARPLVRVGVLLDGPAQDNADRVGRFREQIVAATHGSFDVRFPGAATLEGDWTTAGIDARVTRLLRDPEVDLVLVLGVLASHRFCCRFDVVKPVVAAYVLDREVQDLPSEGGGTGRPFLNYVTHAAPFAADLKAFRALVDFDAVTVLVGEPFLEAVPGLEAGLLAAVRDLGLEIRIVPLATAGDDPLAALKPGVQAVYLGPVTHVDPDDFARVVQGLAARGIPSFSVRGCSEVDRGVLAGLRPRDQLDQRARRVADNVRRILGGEDAGSIAIDFPLDEHLCVNAATARAVGLRLDAGLPPGTEVVGASRP